MKNKVLLISCFLFFQQINAQYTQVPDPNFEQALIHLGIDSEGILDGQFLTTDAIGITFLDVDNRNISDLRGIEAFVNLQWLDAFDNNISEIDLSLITSPDFYTLRIGSNNIATIDLSPIPDLLNIGLENNNITSIDASNLTVAFGLGLADNPLVEITLNNTHIQILDLKNTLITSLNLSSVQSLQKLFLRGSQIQTLDFTNNFYLEEVIAYNTPLTSINLPNNPYLEKLYIWETQLTNLDLTNCNGLIELKASNCLLTQVDLSSNLLYANLDDNLLTSIDLSQSNAPLEIRLNNNLFTTIDLSQSTSLFGIELEDNLITNLDFSNNPNLDYVAIENNPLTSVNFNGAMSLGKVHAKETLLSEVDFSNNPNVDFLNFNHNEHLQLVNLKNGNNNNLTGFYGQFGNPNLSCIVVDDPSAPNENISVQPEVLLIDDPAECVLGINKEKLRKAVTLFPNPVKNILHIQTHNVPLTQLVIYDILGNKLLQKQGNFQTLNISHLPTGVLFVEITSENKKVVRKIIKYQ